MKIADSVMFHFDESKVDDYLFVSHCPLVKSEKEAILSSVEDFYKRNRWFQKALIFYSAIRHLFNRSFMTMGKKKDLYILLRYRSLLDNLRKCDDDSPQLRECLWEGLKKCFTDVRHDSVHYGAGGVYVKGRLLSELLRDYDACQSSSSSKRTVVKFFDYVMNKIKRSYYRFRSPMDACFMLRDHYSFLERVMDKEEMDMDEFFFHQFLLGYGALCKALLPSYTPYSRIFFNKLYRAISQISPEASAVDDKVNDTGSSSEKTPLLGERRGGATANFFTPVENENLVNNSGKVEKKPQRENSIEGIKAQFDNELRLLHGLVLALAESRNGDKSEKLRIIRTIKKMLLQYHPDKHLNEGEALSQVYTQLSQRIVCYYRSVSDYFKTGDSVKLPCWDEIKGTKQDDRDREAMVPEMTERWEQLITNLKDLLKDLDKIREEHREIGKEQEEIGKKQEEIREEQEEIREELKKLEETHKRVAARYERIKTRREQGALGETHEMVSPAIQIPTFKA